MNVFLSCPTRSSSHGMALWEQLTDSGVTTYYYDSPQNRIWNIDNFRHQGMHDSEAVVVVITTYIRESIGVATEVNLARAKDLPILGIKVREDVLMPAFLANVDTIVSTEHRESRERIKEKLQEIIDRHADMTEPSAENVKSIPKIFIAYSRHQRSIAQSVSDMLGESDIPHFWDAKIHAGATWRRTIQKALDDCTHLIVIWTEDAAASDEVEREVSYALAEGKVIIPLLSADIPKLPYHLHGFHYVVLKNHVRQAENDIIDAIEDTSQDDIWL